MSDYILTKDGELYHYGVLGMKWGVRRGRTDRAYEKASKKLRKLDSKVDKAMDKAYKKQAKADAKMDSFFSTEKGYNKAQYKAKKAMRKAVVKTRKAQKWLRAMDKTFASTTASLSPDQINMGKRYADIMDKRVF